MALLAWPVQAQYDPGPGQERPSQVYGARVLTSTAGLLAYTGFNAQDVEGFVGGGYRYPIPLDLPIELLGQTTGEYQFADDGPFDAGEDVVLFLQLDLNLLTQIKAVPWAETHVGLGGGASYYRLSSSTFGGPKGDTELGLNVLATGLFNPAGRLHPFVEGRYASRGALRDAITLRAGVMLSL